MPIRERAHGRGSPPGATACDRVARKMDTPAPPDARRFAPATARNRDPILAVLQRVAPRAGLALEVASGSGEHAVYLAPRLASLAWQPTDADPAARASITAWTAHEGVAGCVRPPFALDASLRGRDPAWGVRDLADVARVAAAHGLALTETVAMPANNLSVVFHSAE